MSTKQNPGPFDDYAALGQNEPYFVLMARRPGDAKFVRMWGAEQREAGEQTARTEDAFNTADTMEVWRDTNVRTSTADQLVLQAFRQIHSQIHPANVTFAQCQEPICMLRKRALAEITALKV